MEGSMFVTALHQKRGTLDTEATPLCQRIWLQSAQMHASSMTATSFLPLSCSHPFSLNLSLECSYYIDSIVLYRFYRLITYAVCYLFAQRAPFP